MREHHAEACVTRALSIHVVRPRQRRTGGDKSNAEGRVAEGGREMSSDVGPGERITCPLSLSGNSTDNRARASSLLFLSLSLSLGFSVALFLLDFSMSFCLFLFITLSFYLPTSEYYLYERTYASSSTTILLTRHEAILLI